MARKEKKYHYIYKITCLKNNRYYIGMHSTDNLDDGYFGGGKRIKNSVKKHGKDAHRKDILEFFESREELVNREIELVDEQLINDPMCMNIKLGGEGWCCLGIQIGGDKWKKMNEYWSTPEGKKHLSEKMKEKWKDAIYRGLISSKTKGNKSFSGRKHSKESKIKIGISNSENHKGEKNSQFGKIWIYNEELRINKKIKKEELQDMISIGFKKGMKMEYFKNKNGEEAK